MANDFTFTLSLETAQFAKAAQDAAQAVQKMSQDAVDSIQKISARTDDLTNRVDAATDSWSSMGRSVAGLSGSGMERHIGGASDAMDKLGGNAQKAAGGIDRAAKAAQALEGLKGMMEPLSDVIDEMGPKTQSAVEGITSVFTSASAGFALGGPIGAAAVGGVAALKGLWDWVHAAGEEELRTIELAGEAQDMLNAKIQEHANLLRQVQQAAADQAQDIIRGSTWEQDAPRRAAEERATAQRARDLQLERERIAAANLPGVERVEAERALDKRALRNRMDDSEAAMQADLEFSRTKQKRLEAQREMFADALATTPEAADLKRKDLTEKITKLDAELESLADAIQKTTWKVNQHRDARSTLVVEEDKTIDAKRDRDAAAIRAAERKAAEDANQDWHARARKAQLERADWFAERDKAAAEPAEALGGGSIRGLQPARLPHLPGAIRGVRFRNGFQFRDGKKVVGVAGGDDGDDDDDDDSAAGPRKIRGVRFRNGFQYRNGKKIMGAAGGDVIPTPDPAGNLGRQGLIPGAAARKATKDPVAEETLTLLRSMNEKLDKIARASK